MLGKLIKYDMKSMSRVLIPLGIAAPVISFLFSLSIKGLVGVTEYTVNHTLESQALIQGSAVVTGIVTLIFFGVMVAILVMTVLFVVQRFWNGLLKEEGYLMFTLPVETWELVLSKGICATAVGCVSSVVAVLSCVVMALGTFGDYTLLWESLGDFVAIWCGSRASSGGPAMWRCLCSCPWWVSRRAYIGCMRPWPWASFLKGTGCWGPVWLISGSAWPGPWSPGSFWYRSAWRRLTGQSSLSARMRAFSVHCTFLSCC